MSTEKSSPKVRRWPGLFLLYLLASLIGLVGAALVAGGVTLVSAGGSWYYALTGAGMVVSAFALFRRRRWGAWLYAFVLGLSGIWSIWEVGLDTWSLLPRLLMLSCFAAALLIPAIQRVLVGRLNIPKWPNAKASLVLATGTVASFLLGLALHAIAGPYRPADPRFQTGVGSFPASAQYAFADGRNDDWPHFGGDRGGSRFTPLDQVNVKNVAALKVAWTADVGARPPVNATPIKIGDSVYICNNNNEIFAFDARTGRRLWSYDASMGFGGGCRGVAYFSSPGVAGECAARILTGTSTAKLVALDAKTGKPCQDFGNKGIVDLTAGMADAEGKVIGGYYRVTSAPTIVRGKAVIGGWVTDGQFWGEPSGVIRAFDAVTGKLAWAWDMGRPNEPGLPPDGASYTPNTPNSWAPMSADEELGMVFLPTGAPTPDYFGAQRRPIDDKFGNSVIALDAETGRLRWSFQTVRHDLWDWDVASQPTLLDLKDRTGVLRKAVIQPTKRGDIFVLDRITGKPIFDVTEKRVPQRGAVPEERLSPTQPFSDKVPSFRNATLTEVDMWGLTPIDQMMCRIQFRQARYEGMFTPPGLTPAISSPSAFGAINWGSVSIDPHHGVMIVNSSRVAGAIQLITRKEATAQGYRRAREFMGQRESVGKGSIQDNTPYATKSPRIQNALGLPCTAPPYGYISAVDLNTGKLVWSQRLGTSLGSGPLGLKFPFALPMGTPNHGGSLVTRSGIVFIGATPDNFLSAFDIRTGKLLWRYALPAGGGTPISYRVDGKQYIVLSAGGQPAVRSGIGTKLIAFTLPDDVPAAGR